MNLGPVHGLSIEYPFSRHGERRDDHDDVRVEVHLVVPEQLAQARRTNHMTYKPSGWPQTAATAPHTTVIGQLEEEEIMHPMFVKLFIETDADDLLTDEQEQQRHARQARRNRSVRVMRVAAPNRDRQRRL
jgi:hypothetical protein